MSLTDIDFSVLDDLDFNISCNMRICKHNHPEAIAYQYIDMGCHQWERFMCKYCTAISLFQRSINTPKINCALCNTLQPSENVTWIITPLER